MLSAEKTTCAHYKLMAFIVNSFLNHQFPLLVDRNGGLNIFHLDLQENFMKLELFNLLLLLMCLEKF